MWIIQGMESWNLLLLHFLLTAIGNYRDDLPSRYKVAAGHWFCNNVTDLSSWLKRLRWLIEDQVFIEELHWEKPYRELNYSGSDVKSIQWQESQYLLPAKSNQVKQTLLIKHFKNSRHELKYWTKSTFLCTFCSVLIPTKKVHSVQHIRVLYQNFLYNKNITM